MWAGLECYVWDIKYNVCSEVERNNGCILSIDVPHSSPARYKLKRGLFRPAAVQQDNLSSQNGASEDERTQQGRWVRWRKSKINLKEWQSGQRLLFFSTFPPVFLSQIFLFIPSCSFDAVDNMAENEEFLPHKSGVKKESRFTDVSAHTQWGLLGFAVWSNHFKS